MTTTTTPQYRRAKTGEWVVFGPSSAIRAGAVVVAKRDGTTKTEQIVRVGKPFVVDGVECVYGYVAPRAAPARSASRTYGRARQDGTYECDECGDFVAAGTRCWETGMEH